jgi:glycosyltransferase involved in cell wall biosynthesis
MVRVGAGADPRALTVGIDARAATEVKAGRGRVVRELLREFSAAGYRHEYVCYARSRWDEPLDDRFAWNLVGTRDPLWHVAVAAMASRDCDVFLSTNSYLTAMLVRVPVVSIIYDLIAFEPQMLPNRRSVLIERLTLGGAARRSRALVCISEATGQALLTRFPNVGSRMLVAPLGVATTLTRSAPAELESLPAPGFVLAVGTLEPRKNLPRLVAAFARLPAAVRAAHPLVVVGAHGWQTGDTLDALRSLGEDCVLLGHVSDEALAELYRRCAVFCYPSLGEGFGLPVLEAMAAGAAVITSGLSSLPEVGGDAVAYVDPTQVAAISERLEQLLADEAARASLGRRAAQRAQQFTWRSFADTVAEALDVAGR